jgi:hypothetical protein
MLIQPKQVFETAVNTAAKEINNSISTKLHNKSIYSIQADVDSNIELFKEFSGYKYNFKYDYDHDNKLLEIGYGVKDPYEVDHSFYSYVKDDKTYETDMWRGPVWINYNYMISEGLRKYGYKNEADEIVKSTIAMISKWYKNDGTIYEFYDSENEISPSRLNRKGEAVFPYMPKVKMQAIKDFGWSSALVAEMILKSAK